jgi:hypothetical protein
MRCGILPNLPGACFINITAMDEKQAAFVGRCRKRRNP